MSIEPIRYFYLECDHCYSTIDENFPLAREAQRWADDHGWQTIGDNHYCQTCQELEEVIKLGEGY
jgi:hypothetical protein